MKTLDDSMYIQVLNTHAALDNIAYPASGSYIDVSNFERFAFLVAMGTFNSDVDFQVYQDTSATETAGVKAITGAAKTDLANATDDNKWFTIEVETARLDIANGYRYVTLKVTNAAGGDDYGAILFLGWRARHMPVTQPAAYAEAVVVAG